MLVKHSRKGRFQTVPTMNRSVSLTAIGKLYKMLPRGVIPYDPDTESWSLVPPPDIDYESYRGTVDQLRPDRLRLDFLSKARFLRGTDPRGAAVATFLAAEQSCLKTNAFLRGPEVAKYHYFNRVCFTAARKISKVLGRFNVDELLSESRWGPGSTSSVRGQAVAPERKFGAELQSTHEFSVVASQLLAHYPSWSALQLDHDFGIMASPLCQLIQGNRVTFVAKNAKTHRSIAVEPHVNVFFQNGLGRMLRKRILRGTGIDLNDQGRNRRMAHEGSRSGRFATIDLSSASDTLASRLVSDLLPADWFWWLDITRSKRGTMDGGKTYFPYHKFSSMGNGFTFDLESLIFWALSSSAVELCDGEPRDVSVFGDDIIVPGRHADRVLRVLQLAGFTANVKKTYTSGPFRESCGCDYFNGAQVRPVYLKELPSTPFDWIKLANGLRTLAHTWCNYQGCDKRLKGAWEFAVSQIPKEFLTRIPCGFGDGGLVSNFDEACPSPARDGWEGWVVECFQPKAVKYETLDRSLVVAGTHQPAEKQGNAVPFRDRVTYQKATLIVPTWYDLGGWI